jgi:3-isopropylmalate/(R)-2-methylmalate dehydratase small subunit
MSVKKSLGKVWKFGDNISTDFMAPGFTPRGLNEIEGAQYCMRVNRPEWAKQVKPKDIVIGGRNFGCGSSRPAASLNLMTLGVSCVIAESLGRTFFRNSVNLGLPALACEGVSEAFEEGDMGLVDFKKGKIKNQITGKILKISPLPELVIKILEAGGVVPLLKKEYTLANSF